jgi:hypothetical protein
VTIIAEGAVALGAEAVTFVSADGERVAISRTDLNLALAGSA